MDPEYCLKSFNPLLTFTTTYTTTSGGGNAWPTNSTGASGTVKCLCSKCRGGDPKPGAGA